MGKFKTLKFAAELAILAIIYSSFLGAAYADINTWKPLNTWAQTQIIVFNSDLDDKIHFEVWYSLDELWANVTADPSIQLGLSNEYKNRYRAPEPRADFTTHDINEMLRVGYVFEVLEDTVKIYWSDRALNLHVDGNPDLPLLEDLNQDPTGVFQSLTLDNPALWVNRHKVANDKHAIHEITYFHIYMWKMSPPPEKVVDGELGEGGQIMGDPWLRYYWGLLTNEQSTAAHTWLTVPEANYGPGTYCAVVKTRLGLWDYSYYDYWMYDPQHGIYGPQFEVERFYSALPTARGTIRNPGSDSIIVIDIPAYSDFSPPSSTDDGLPPSFYMIEISESSSFPWSEPPESPRKTVYAYPEAKDEPMSIYLSVDSLDHGVDKFYGRIGCVGPAGQYWTDGPKALLGPNADGSFNVYYWTTRLPAVTDFNVTNPGEDTTLQITITRPKYSDFIAIAQAATPTVNIYLVHDNIYSTYSSNQEKIMEVIYDPGHAHYSKIKTIPVDIVNQATPIKVNAEVPFEATGIYHVCARSSADGFTPGEFSGWQSTNIQVDQDHLTTQLATIPEDKWSVDNTGGDAHISISINPYSEFIGTHDRHDAYDIKVTDGTKTGYAYALVEEPDWPIDIFLDLCEMNDGSGGFINLVETVPATLKVTVRCLADGMTPGEWSTEKTIIINYAASADFDWDGDVDWTDLDVFNASWLKRKGEPGYNPQADLYRDEYNIVNFRDYAVFANLWNPHPPSELSAQAASSTRINLSWQDNTDGESGFKIQRKIGATGTFALIDTAGEDITIYTDTGLEPGQTYYYRIYAYKARIDYSSSGFSNVATATTELNHPPLVSTIPNQIILQGEEFATINLDDYVKDIETPDSQISWEVSGATQLDVYIDVDRVATITHPEGWTGSETVNFIATDPDGLSDSTEATFIVARDSKEIQDDIDTASPGDVVPLQSGIYKLTSNLNITKAITLKAIVDPDPDNTIIILGDYSIIVKFPQPPADYPLANGTIEGVTITGYSGISKNGPIQNYWANLTLMNCKIVDNKGVKVSAIYNSLHSIINLENTLIAKNINIPSNDIYQYGYSPFRGYLWGELYCGTIYLEWFSELYVSKSSTIADNINASMPITIQTGYGETGYGQTGYGTRKLNIVYGAIQRTMSNRVEMTNSIMWKNGRGNEYLDFSYILLWGQIRRIINSDIQNLGIVTRLDYLIDVIREDPLFEPEDTDYLPHNQTCIDKGMGARF